jgi:hypothetical protein
MDTELFYILFWFIAGSKGTQNLFCDLIKRALDYKYKDYRNIAIPVSEEFVRSNPIFELSEKDEIKFYGDHVINGKKLKEIYITTIFARLLDTSDYFRNWDIKNKICYIAYIEKENTDIDTYIFVIPKREIRTGQKIYFPPGTIVFSFQVKECVNYKDLYSKDILTPEEIRIDKFGVKRLKYYGNFILIYLRGFFQLDTEKIKEDLKKQQLEDKNIIFIGMPWNEKIPEKWVFNIWDAKEERIYPVSFEPCKLFKTFSMKKSGNTINFSQNI